MKLTKREFVSGASALAVAAAGSRFVAATPAHAGETAMTNASQASLLIRKAEDVSTQDVTAWLKALRGRPYVAQSGFDVTSVFKINTAQGMYYVGGVNVENRELTGGTCGEEGALAAAITAFGQEIDVVEGWVMGAPSGATSGNIPCYPCGECRQRIAQYTAPEAMIHMIGVEGDILDSKSRDALLPNAFSFRDLEHTGEAVAAPALAEMGDVTQRLYRQSDSALTTEQIFDWLQGLRADVRVSHYNEMTVWRLTGGKYVAAVKLENAAYPSSTNVMSAAAAVMNARYGEQLVEEVWAYGFHNDAAKHEPMRDAHYQPSGASLQVLHQFAANPQVKLHQFNSRGMVKTAALAGLLPAAPVFG